MNAIGDHFGLHYSMASRIMPGEANSKFKKPRYARFMHSKKRIGITCRKSRKYEIRYMKPMRIPVIYALNSWMALTALGFVVCTVLVSALAHGGGSSQEAMLLLIFGVCALIGGIVALVGGILFGAASYLFPHTWQAKAVALRGWIVSVLAVVASIAIGLVSAKATNHMIETPFYHGFAWTYAILSFLAPIVRWIRTPVEEL